MEQPSVPDQRSIHLVAGIARIGAVGPVEGEIAVAVRVERDHRQRSGLDAGPAGGIEAAIRHLAHMVEIAGEDHVALGSDFDGAPMPEGLQSAAELPTLVEAMRAQQFGEALIAKICHRNWLDFIGRTLG